MARRKISRVPLVDWERYKNIINDFIDIDAGKQPFLWMKKVTYAYQPLPFGEDSYTQYIIYQLEGLFQYNYIRTWPSSIPTVSGELSDINVSLYISANLLRENGFLDSNGYWDFNWVNDRFILNGKVYKPSGDTQVAQANNEALLFFITLKREDPEESFRLLNTANNQDYIVISNLGDYILDSDYIQLRDKDNLPIYQPF